MSASLVDILPIQCLSRYAAAHAVLAAEVNSSSADQPYGNLKGGIFSLYFGNKVYHAFKDETFWMNYPDLLFVFHGDLLQLVDISIQNGLLISKAMIRLIQYGNRY